MKQRYSLTVSGSKHTWVFPISAPPEHVADWRADGFDVTEVVNTIPAHMPYWLMRLWAKAQDIWRN